ncbi:hypothetical protein LINPERHAP1_LOCUS34307 [Linum perenne]
MKSMFVRSHQSLVLPGMSQVEVTLSIVYSGNYTVVWFNYTLCT